MMNGDGKSDSSIVPEKPPNKATQVAAEVVEGRELAKGNLFGRNMLRTQSRINMSSAHKRVRQARTIDGSEWFCHSHLSSATALRPKAGAGCGSTARPDLCGGPPARAVPTATAEFFQHAASVVTLKFATKLNRHSGQAGEASATRNPGISTTVFTGMTAKRGMTCSTSFGDRALV